VSVQPVGKAIFLDKIFNPESASRKGSQCCISCSIQIDAFVTQHAQVFNLVGVGEWSAIIVKSSRQFIRPGVEAHDLRFLRFHGHRL